MFKLIHMLKQKLEFLPAAFAVILSAVALLAVQKFELNFEYYTLPFLFSKVRKLL